VENEELMCIIYLLNMMYDIYLHFMQYWSLCGCCVKNCRTHVQYTGWFRRNLQYFGKW